MSTKIYNGFRLNFADTNRLMAFLHRQRTEFGASLATFRSGMALRYSLWKPAPVSGHASFRCNRRIVRPAVKDQEKRSSGL